MADAIRALLTTKPWGFFFEIIEPTYLELTMKLYSTFYLQVVMTNFDDPGTVQFRLGGLVRQLSVPEFEIALGLYTEEFMDDNELDTLHRHIHYSSSKFWKDIVPVSATYDPSCSKERSHLCWALCDSIGSVLWAPQHSGTIILPHSHPPDVPTGHLEHAHMRMIEKRRGTHPPQYRLIQSTEEEDPEDIPDDVPPRHEDPLSQPLPIHCPVHAVASYSDISEHLTQFEQQCFQRFDHIDTTLHQICQHLHISSPQPPREPSGDDDV
ncbi:hypothetical protein PVK06_043681 [Gossypium arboreum]|uniref:Uncharacterized protein n=1 Tax=Gossypium arboreum TaxID=29729 RepID=A0ABR0MPL0_GOSAR|nr:hypothetical protein PVK06_043681 [Gossypium arboreum]